MPMNRKLYPPNWEQIAHHIIWVRAGGRCESCGVRGGTLRSPTKVYVKLACHHLGVPKPDGSPGDKNDKMDCRPENLIALCQKCHWIADLAEHLLAAALARSYAARQRQIAAGQLELPLCLT